MFEYDGKDYLQQLINISSGRKQKYNVNMLLEALIHLFMPLGLMYGIVRRPYCAWQDHSSSCNLLATCYHSNFHCNCLVSPYYGDGTGS